MAATQDTDTTDQRDPELVNVEADYPGWHTWRGVAGLLYARRPRTSPPKVVRSTTIPGLRSEIEAKEAGA